MKQPLSKASIYLSCIAAILFFLPFQNLNAQVIVTEIPNFVMLSGNGGPGTTPPGAAGYGVIFGSSSTITGGNIGSYHLVQTTGGASLTSNIYSDGKVILANGNNVSGRVTAQNLAGLPGNILQVGSNAVLSGIIDVNGNINIQSGTVTGPVHVTGTYTGPTPTSLPITNNPTFPVLPAFPEATVFPAAGDTNITNTRTINPGTYNNVTFSNNKTLTFNGPGVYVFNSINLTGNNTFVYNFQSQAEGVIKVYVHGNAFLGKFNASLINGGAASRIMWEVHGSGAGSTSGSDAVTIANGSSGGSGTVKFQGTILAYNAGILLGSGTGSSQFTGTLLSRVRVMVQTGVSLTYSFFQECSTPVANAGTDVNICGSGNALLGAAPVAGITYSWSPATGLSSSTVSNPTVTSSTPGTTVYTVTTTVTSTTCTASDQVSVSVHTLPNVNAGTDSQHDCVLASTTLSGSSTTPGALFNWTTGSLGNISAGANTQTPTVNVYGTFLTQVADFILTVTDPATGCTANDTAVVSFNPCIFPGYIPPNNGKTDDLIGSELNFLFGNFSSGNPNPDIFAINGSQVWVEIIYNEGMFAQLNAILTQAPFNLTIFIDNGTGNRIITTLIDVTLLQTLNNLNITTGINLINHVRPLFPPIATAGVAYTLGDVAQKSDETRSGFNVDGEGIKVGVISNSYNTLLGNPALTDVVNGDLPGVGNPDGHTTPVQVLQEYPFGIQNDEGRAMLQLVHDIAPEADLVFTSGFVSEGNMAAQIGALQAAGCDVGVDDVTYINAPFYRDGMISQAIQDVTALGMSYFTSAGNFGAFSCEGTYNATAAPGSLIGTAHDFDAGAGVDAFQNISLAPGNYLCVLQWEDEFYSFDDLALGAASDIDIYLTYDNGITLFGMNRDNNGTLLNPVGGDPVEVLSFTVTQNTSTNILIVRESGSAPITKFKYVFFKNPANNPVINEYSQGNSTTVGHANCDEAISVGAVLYSNTPEYGVNPPTKASFSSVGGTTTEGVQRNKPDVCAPNGGNTTVQLGGPNIDLPDFPGGDAFPNFYGTSAAAPHAAGIAALLLHAKDKYYGTTLTPAEVKTLLTSNTTDMYDPGFDFLSGYGFVNADASMRTFAAPTPVLVSLDNIPPGSTPTDSVQSFTLIVTADFITTQSQIVFREETLATTWIDEHHLSALIPTFLGNPPVQVCTPPITPSEDDGGCSNILYFFSPDQIDVVIVADNKDKLYGETLPTFTATITVDGIPLASSGYTLEDLGLEDLSFNSPATSMSNVGIYFIEPAADVSDVGLQEVFDYTFTNGLITIGKMPLLITPVDKTVDYGDKIDGTEFDFVYVYDDSNIAPAEQADFLIALETEYESPIIPYVAFVNDQTIFNGRPLANSDLTNLALICGGRALANGGRPLANGGRALANSTTPDTTFIIDVAYQSLMVYYEDSSTAALTLGHPLANGGRGLVNGRPLANGHALANGRPLANGHPLANSSSLSDESNNNVAVIIHETDVHPDSNAIISEWHPINLITGTDAGCHFSVPAAFITANFEVTYGTADFCVDPYELKIDVQDTTTEYGDAPAYSALITGLQYDDTQPIVLTGTLTFSPSDICALNVGTHVISASGLALDTPSNYTLIYETGTLNVTPATLTAEADDKSRPYAFPNPSLTISYSGFKCSDGPADITEPTASTTAVLLSPSGNYDITLSGGSAQNYNINLVNGTLTVEPVPSCTINSPASLPICSSSGNILSATAPAGYTYSWSLTGTGWQITAGDGTTSVTYTAGADGTSGTFILTLYAPESTILISSCTLTVGTLCGVEYCAYGQGAWGSSNGSACNGTPTSVLLPTLLSTPLVSGDGSRKITFGTTESSCMITKLPAGGSSVQLPVGNVSCAGATGNQYLSGTKFKSNLLGQSIALALSVRYTPALGSLNITGPYITTYAASSCENGLPVAGTKQVFPIGQKVVTYLGANNTVNDLIILANKGLGGTLPGGNTVPSLTEIATAVNSMINAFNSCRIFIGFTATAEGARVENTDVSSDVTNLFVYPNPASGNTTISFVAAEGSRATLDIYGINGAVVANVLEGTVTENGLYSVDIDASPLSRGIYFIRLTLDGEVSVTKLVVIE